MDNAILRGAMPRHPDAGAREHAADRAQCGARPLPHMVVMDDDPTAQLLAGYIRGI